MKIGLQLHLERGLDAVLEEAQSADRQGFDSVWLSDHLFNTSGNHRPDQPLETLTLATAIGAVTSRTRLAWATLNITLRPPALLAKMLASIDQITHGRLIATLGSGWNLPEWGAYDLPAHEDHDERAEYAREVIQLMKLLWSHPAPELTTFEGKYVSVKDLPFNPAPYQKPMPPIWFGGDSEATLQTVKGHCDGWMSITSAGVPEKLRAVLTADDWPTRPITVVNGHLIVVRETEADAIDAARIDYERVKIETPFRARGSFDEFVERSIVGSPEQCMGRISQVSETGITYLRVIFGSDESQAACAELVLPRLAEISPIGAQLAVR